MAKTFTKVRKWAEERGYKVEDVKGFGGLPCIVIHTVMEGHVIPFELEIRESTIYHSIRGMKGRPKGMYLSVRGGRSSSALHQSTQGIAITVMENRMKREVQFANN